MFLWLQKMQVQENDKMVKQNTRASKWLLDNIKPGSNTPPHLISNLRLIYDSSNQTNSQWLRENLYRKNWRKSSGM